MPKDPVCGMQVKENSSYGAEYRGETYRFCSEHCKASFENDPEAFLGSRPRVAVRERKVCIVGYGNVGSFYAFSLMKSGLADDIVIIGRDPDKVRAHVMDLNHGLMFTPHVTVRGGDYSDCADADMVAVTAGVPQEPGETRIDLAKRNAGLFKKLIPDIARHDPRTLLVVTNPVDVLTYVAIKTSGLPMNRIMGSGTVLDTARFRYLLSRHCRVAPRNVHGYILGEHGDTEVPIWSRLQFGAVPMHKYCEACDRACPGEDLRNIFLQVKNAAYEIIKGKGATYYAIALAMVRITEAVLRDERSVLTVSTLVDDQYGIVDVCLSVPCIVGRSGVEQTLEIDLDPDEAEKLKASADMLKHVRRGAGF
jgi:L-lactate dehydrogenase